MAKRWNALPVACVAAAAVLAAAGAARAQTAEANAPQDTWHRLAVTAGGAFLHTSDANEGSAEHGRFLLDVAVRPAAWLEVAARYGDSMGPWDYVSSRPALGGELDRLHGFEHLHALDLGARLDLVRAVADEAQPYHVWPYLGFAYLGLQSAVFESQAFGGGGGLGFAYDIDPRTSLDASFTAIRSFVNGGDGAVYGPIEGIWSWSGGVSLGVTEASRLRVAYVGEALDRAHTTRESHGVLFMFQLGLL